ncbi:MAG: DUF4331 domain-containing protein [Actinomycetota bacterium]|nr:DUF4331 domain-containing protein [Actinomycetota bacterium]
MARPIRSTAARRALAIATAAAAVAGSSALLTPGTSLASSHREAPYISTDPAVDNTDTYAFVSPDAPGTATLIANVSPFQDPAGGPNYYPFATDARYNINIDNNGDGVPDVTFRWTFKDVDNRGTTAHGDKAGGTFLYNDGPIKTLTDAHLLFRQTYTLTQVVNPTSNSPVSTDILTDVPVPPDNIGIGSIPDYITLRDQAVQAGTVGSGTFAGVKAYAGQRKDPFFLDLRVFDLLYGGNLKETGFNHLVDKSVNTMAIQVPFALLAGGGDPKANPVVGVWASTERQSVRTLAATGAAPATSATRSSDTVTASGNWSQVSRLGNPLVNEVVVPANLKDYFNRSTPDTDHTVQPVVDKVTDPELPNLVKLLYGIPNPNGTPKGAGRPDLFHTFLTGLSAKNYPDLGLNLNGMDLNANNVGVPSEELRLNLGIPASSNPNRLGAIGGDAAGFPNGRRLRDDVVDIALKVVEGVLIPDQDPALKATVKTLGDGVDNGANGLGGVFTGDGVLGAFPYVADPNPGSDIPIGATPVTFTQNFSSKNGVVSTNISNLSPAIPGGFAQLYRVNADGSLTGLAMSQLNAAGTATTVHMFNAPVGSKLTLNYRVFPPRTSSAQVNRGLPTTITVH